MEKKKQKTVELISFELKDYRIIRAVKLDFDKWQNENILEIVGDMGNGKSSLLEGLAMATTGTDHIKDKDLLELGFKSEVQLADGEHNLFLGVKVSEISRGERKGNPKFETYIYEKDKEGKLTSNPIIDGVKATAKEYTKLLSTALTFKMADMFDKSQSTHRKLIEELFSKELSELGVEDILANIKSLKIERDDARHERDRAAATMTAFNEKGLDEAKLDKIVAIPIPAIENKIKELEIKKGVLANSSDKDKELKLSEIANKGRAITDKIREFNEVKQKTFNEAKDKYDNLAHAYKTSREGLDFFISYLDDKNGGMPNSIYSDLENTKIKWNGMVDTENEDFLSLTEPTPPEIIEIIQGKPDTKGDVPPDYTALIENYKVISQEYITIKNEEEKPLDTSEIDLEILKADAELKVAEDTNDIVKQYSLWCEWIKADGLYQKEQDVLRKLYTKINTGVYGLIIAPDFTESNKIEIWLEYNGIHDVELFKNKSKKHRRLHEYSKSQGSIIGVLLQAARLDKKDKALRLVVLDDATQTKAGKNLLGSLCKEKNLKLVIAKTSDEYDVNKLTDGTIVIENGEILL